VTFNLGAGVKIYPWKHWGFRFDLLNHVSGGGTGNLDPPSSTVLSALPICTQEKGAIGCSNPSRFFGSFPVQNNVVFTVGLIFRII